MVWTEITRPRYRRERMRYEGRKRHIVTDTQGHLVGLVVHEASIQDRDGAPCVHCAHDIAVMTISVMIDRTRAGNITTAPRRRNRQAPTPGPPAV